jgi:hypothetical protein
MYCPRCGQEQTTSEVHFCSRCGFQLENVKKLLSSNGLIPGEPKSNWLLSRKEGLRQGTILFLIGMVLVPILAIISDEVVSKSMDGVIALAAIICFVGGLARMLYAAIFGSNSMQQQKKVWNSLPKDSAGISSSSMSMHTTPTSLPPSDAIPFKDLEKKKQVTGELVQPPHSVVDHTTKLFNLPSESKQE